MFSVNHHKFLTIVARFVVFTVFLVPGVVLAGELAEFEQGGLRVVLSDNSDTKSDIFRFALSPTRARVGAGLSADVFTLNNPVRLVIDVPNYQARKSQQVLLSNERLKKLRVGIHSKKIRFVIDASGAVEPSFSVEPSPSNDALYVYFNFHSGGNVKSAKEDVAVKGNKQKKEEELPHQPEMVSADVSRIVHEKMVALKKVEKKKGKIKKIQKKVKEVEEVQKVQKLKDLGKKSNESTRQVIKIIGDQKEIVHESVGKTTSNVANSSEGDEIISQNTKKAPMEKVDEAEKVELASLKVDDLKEPKKLEGATVTGVIFKKNPELQSAALVAKVKDLNRYSLVRKESNVYRLVLENAQLAGRYLELPQFPPDNFVGMEVVVVKEESGKVIMDIYVEENVRLTPYRTRGELWIKIVK